MGGRSSQPELRMPSKYLAYVPSPPLLRLLYKTRPLPSNKQGRRKKDTLRLRLRLRHTHPKGFGSARTFIHGASRPAVGRHGGRTKAGPRPRQAPQVRLLLPVLHRRLRLRDDHRRRAVGRRGGAGRDAEHHHPPPAGSVRHVAARRVRLRLRALVPGQRPRLPLRHSNDAQGRGLEQAAPERQDGRRRHGRRQPRHPQEPHRLRLGGDQLAGPLITDPSISTKTTETCESSTRAAAN